MNTAKADDSASRAIDEAETALGGRLALARQLRVTPGAIGNWKVRGVPIKACVQIEALVPLVTRQRLRPSDWHEIWPDLAAANDAPQQPAPGAPATAVSTHTSDNHPHRRATDIEPHAAAGGG